ncbi:hypothetical protein AGMMS49592_5750 [Endomicrobiia bacterium]|nr:hypothetical protein AGMMS49592_5750 [Endomicrobiia bacterium]
MSDEDIKELGEQQEALTIAERNTETARLQREIVVQEENEKILVAQKHKEDAHKNADALAVEVGSIDNKLEEIDSQLKEAENDDIKRTNIAVKLTEIETKEKDIIRKLKVQRLAVDGLNEANIDKNSDAFKNAVQKVEDSTEKLKAAKAETLEKTDQLRQFDEFHPSKSKILADTKAKKIEESMVLKSKLAKANADVVKADANEGAVQSNALQAAQQAENAHEEQKRATTVAHGRLLNKLIEIRAESDNETKQTHIREQKEQKKLKEQKKYDGLSKCKAELINDLDTTEGLIQKVHDYQVGTEREQTEKVALESEQASMEREDCLGSVVIKHAHTQDRMNELEKVEEDIRAGTGELERLTSTEEEESEANAQEKATALEEAQDKAEANEMVRVVLAAQAAEAKKDWVVHIKILLVKSLVGYHNIFCRTS